MLQRLQDRELSCAGRGALERHLDGCPECAAELAWLERDERLLRSARPAVDGPAPETARRILHAALAQSANSPWRKVRRLLFGTLGIASAAGALFLGAVLIPRSDPPASTLRRSAGRQLAGPAPVLEPEPVPPKDTEARREPCARGTARKPAWKGSRGGGFRRRARSRRLYLASIRNMRPRTSAREELKQAVAPELGRLMVLVTDAPEPKLEVQVRNAGENEPGYARASAAEWNPRDGITWKQCTVSSEKPEPQLALITSASQFAQSFTFK